MDIIHIIILGIVEGVTEFLPISSTGHLILANTILQLPQTEFLKTFDIAIQLGAIGSVVALFFKRFLDLEVIKKLIVAFIPTGIIGLAAYSFVKTYLLGNPWVVVIALGIGGIFIILFEWWHKEHDTDTASISDISYKQALMIGLFQSVAIIPGASRSAATILGGLFLGLSRVTIVEFSFLLAVPTMVAATAFDLLKNASTFSASDLGALGTGFVISFIVALGAITFLMRYVQTHSFVVFGIYRIAIALLVIAFIL